MKQPFQFIIAESENHIKDAIELFKEYAASLNISLAFQHFDEELKTVHQMYGAPEGLLLLVYDLNIPIACAAFRKIEDDTCEVKRMYVKPTYRRHQIGDQLMNILISSAKSVGYKCMRLDTLNTMIPAIALYKKHGFNEREAYYFNPNENTVYMEKAL